MGRAGLWTRRVIAAVVVLVVIWFVASFAYVIWKEPLGGSILLLLLGLLGGLLFFFWITLRAFGGLIRFLVRPTEPKTPGLGAEYEAMVRAQSGRRWRKQ